MERDTRLDFVDVMQAMIGKVTPNWRAIFAKRGESTLNVTFVLERESAEDREEIDYFSFELEALQINPLEDQVDVAVVVSTAPLTAFAGAGRMVFARKE